MSQPASILVVAHQTAETEGLLAAVRERSQRGPAQFHLVVPRMPHGIHRLVDPEETGGTTPNGRSTARYPGFPRRRGPR